MARLLALALLLALPAHAEERIDTEADGSRTLVTEASIEASPDRLWQAVTTAEGWKRWATPAAWTVNGDPELIETAYDPAAKPGDARNIQQRFVARLPRRLLVFRTVKTPEGFPHAEAFKHVTQFLELIPESGGTRVRLTGVNYPAGADGDALLGFFRTGNAQTLAVLQRAMALAPLDFLVGHCWQGTLPDGNSDTHCFAAAPGEIRDHHEVVREGKRVYWGDTVYAWEDGTIRFVYTAMDGGTMKGSVRAAPDGLDFGTSDFVGKDGRRFPITTRWVRLSDTAYEARNLGAEVRTTRYTRID